MSDSELGWLKSRLEHVQAELDKVDAKLEQAQSEVERLREAAFKAGYHIGHNHTVEGVFYWCDEGTDDVYKDWLSEDGKNG